MSSKGSHWCFPKKAISAKPWGERLKGRGERKGVGGCRDGQRNSVIRARVFKRHRRFWFAIEAIKTATGTMLKDRTLRLGFLKLFLLTSLSKGRSGGEVALTEGRSLLWPRRPTWIQSIEQVQVYFNS